MAGPFARSLQLAEQLLRWFVATEVAVAIVGDLEEDLRTDGAGRRSPRIWLFWQVSRHAVAALRLRLARPFGAGRLWYILRFALRPWRRTPMTATLIVLILGIASGAQATFVSLMDAIVWRPLPIERPDQLVSIAVVDARGSATQVNPAFLRALQGRSSAFRVVSGYLGGRLTVEVDGELHQVPVGLVEGRFFDVMRGQALLGRLLQPADVGRTASSSGHIAVVGSRFWATVLHGDSQVVGRRLDVEGVALTIIGVVPDRFTGLQVEAMNDVVLPAALLPELVGEPDPPDATPFQALIGRLRDDETIDRARRRLEEDWPTLTATGLPGGTASRPASSTRPAVASAETGFSFVRTRYESTLGLLTGLAATMILVGCLSVGGLLAAASLARIPEFQVRLALGASTGDIARQLFVEAGALCGAGSLVGMGMAGEAARPILSRLWPRVDLRDVNLSVDGRVLALTVGTFLVATLLAGVVPAVVASRRLNPVGSLTPRTASPRSTWQARGLVAQLALTLTLMIGAGLFVRTFAEQRPVVSGPPLDTLLSAHLLPQPGGYAKPVDAAYDATLVERLRAVPGVSAVAIARQGPFAGLAGSRARPIGPVGGRAGDGPLTAVADDVSPGFFETIGVRIVQGRDFAWTDVGPLRVAVLSVSLATRLFPTGEVIGRVVRFGSDPALQAIRVVGVAADSDYQDIRELHSPVIYLSSLQGSGAEWGTVIIRVAKPSPVAFDAISRTVTGLGREYVLILRSFADDADLSLLRERLTASVSAFFAALSGLLAAMGVYGRLSQVIAQRRREFGIRLALGASPAIVGGGILWEGARAALWAVAIGGPGALALAQLLGSQLPGVTIDDPTVFGTAILALLLLSIGASVGPARRARGANPVEALRSP